MNQKELTKTFMMISNRKKTWVTKVYKKNNKWFKGSPDSCQR